MGDNGFEMDKNGNNRPSVPNHACKFVTCLSLSLRFHKLDQYALNANENIKNAKGTINRTPNRQTREKMFIFRGENRAFVNN